MHLLVFYKDIYQNARSSHQDHIINWFNCISAPAQCMTYLREEMSKRKVLFFTINLLKVSYNWGKLEKRRSDLVKKFPHLYGSRRFTKFRTIFCHQTSPSLCAVCSLFNDAVLRSKLDNLAENDWFMENNELERIWEEACLEFSQNFPGENYENRRTCQISQCACQYLIRSSPEFTSQNFPLNEPC
jgi:hypothetical protein